MKQPIAALQIRSRMRIGNAALNMHVYLTLKNADGSFRRSMDSMMRKDPRHM